MNILITGLNNYLGKRLAHYLANEGNQVFCLVRNETHFLNTMNEQPNITVIRGDLVKEKFAPAIPYYMDVAIYLSQDSAEWNEQYRDLELLSLNHFIKQARRTNCDHLVYITRLRTPFVSQVKQLLIGSYIHHTIIRMSNIIGRESILMQMMKKISSKLMIVINDRLSKFKSQPIALVDLLTYINFLLLNPIAFNQQYDIGGPDVLSYKEMLASYLKVNKLKRKIITVPSVSNELSAIMISLTTGVSVSAARAYGENITSDLLCADNRIHEIFPHECLPFEEALCEAIEDDGNKVY